MESDQLEKGVQTNRPEWADFNGFPGPDVLQPE